MKITWPEMIHRMIIKAALTQIGRQKDAATGKASLGIVHRRLPPVGLINQYLILHKTTTIHRDTNSKNEKFE
jgi:hypothetical protein